MPIGTELCFIMGAISGTVATKVGAVNLASTDCINPLPRSYTSFAFSSHQVVLTVSNTDQICSTYYGVLSADGAITGNYTVYGGTGRLANATGGGTLQGSETIDLATGAGVGQIQLHGSLSY